MTIVTPDVFQTNTYDAKRWRTYMSHGGSNQAGVLGSLDFRVTAGTGAFPTVDVAAGSALVPTTSTSREFYRVENDANLTVTVAAPNALNNRVDRVCIKVNDTSAGDGTDSAQIVVLSGTPTSGATVDNMLGAATVPSRHLLIADIGVPTGSTTNSQVNIKDRRPWGHWGMIHVRDGTGGTNYTTTGTTSPGTIVTPITSSRLELTGNPVVITASGSWSHSVASAHAALSFVITNSTTATGFPTNTLSQVDGRTRPMEFLLPPTAGVVELFNTSYILKNQAAGSYRFALYANTITAGTLTIYKSVTTPLHFTVHEVQPKTWRELI